MKFKYFIFILIIFSVCVWAEAVEDYKKGLAALNRGNYFIALENFKSSITRNPYFAPAYFETGRVYYRLNNYDSAVYYCSEAVRINNNYVEPFNLMIKIHIEKEEYAAAENLIARILETSPQNIETLLLNARLLSAQRRNYAAGRVIENILVLDPRNSQAYELLIEINSDGGFEDLKEIYLNAARNTGEDKFVIDYSRVLIENGFYDSAVLNLRKIRPNKFNDTINYYRAYAHLKKGEYTRALNFFKNIKNSVKNVDYKKLFFNFLEKNNFEEVYTNYLKNNEYDIYPLLKYERYVIDNFNVDSPIRLESSEKYYSKARFYDYQGNIYTTNFCFLKAILLNPQNADIYYRYARFLNKIKYTGSAYYYIESAKELDINNKDISDYYGFLKYGFDNSLEKKYEKLSYAPVKKKIIVFLEKRRENLDYHYDYEEIFLRFLKDYFENNGPFEIAIHNSKETIESAARERKADIFITGEIEFSDNEGKIDVSAVFLKRNMSKEFSFSVKSYDYYFKILEQLFNFVTVNSVFEGYVLEIDRFNILSSAGTKNFFNEGDGVLIKKDIKGVIKSISENYSVIELDNIFDVDKIKINDTITKIKPD